MQKTADKTGEQQGFRLAGVDVVPRPARPLRRPLPVSPDMARLGLTIRPETPDDIPLLRTIYAETRAAEMTMVAWDADTKRDFVEKQFAYQYLHHSQHFGAGDFGIVLLGGRPAGRIYLYWSDHAADCRLFEVQLLSRFRGRGLGSTLLAALLGHARSCKHSVSLHVDRMSPARRLYARFGFRDTGMEHLGSLLMQWRDGPVVPGLRLAE